jgi:8-amino-7-oxononanoate synthase
MPASHERALKALERRRRLRSLQPRAGLDFSSLDYLGLANAPEIKTAIEAAIARGVATGAGGSRLLRGNDPEHEALESEAARFFRSEAALFFGGGFMANYTIFSTLPARGDLIVYDALIHASVHDGMAASKANSIAARHNDTQSFDDAIARWRAEGGTGTPWIAVESLYSMDGDRAPLEELSAVARHHEAILVIDEAHATGVLGPDGRGLGASLKRQQNIVSMHTCGKALGVSGALVLLPCQLRDFLINRGRALIYATAPSPLMAAAVRASLSLVETQSWRRERLASLVAMWDREFAARCVGPTSGSHIQPIVLGADERTAAVAATLQEQGFDVRAVRPPTVPEGSARLRVSLTLNVEERETTQLIDALAPLLTETTE